MTDSKVADHGIEWQYAGADWKCIGSRVLESKAQ